MRMFIVLTICVLGGMMTAFAGDLTPPTGAPASTMKPLDQIEPRIAIQSLPFVITQSGSFYLTGNLSLVDVNTSGILITSTAAHVTLDLSGFELAGPGKEAGDSGSGIYVENAYPAQSIRIFNGMARDWRESGIGIGGAAEVDIHHVTAKNNGGNGILLGFNSSGVVADCIADDNGGSGIVLQGNGTRVLRYNTCTRNTENGIIAVDGIAEGNVASYNTGHGMIVGGGMVRNNTTRNNQMDGIYDYGDTRIEGNTCINNIVNGIHCTYGGSVIVNNMCRMNLGTGLIIDDAFAYSSQNVLIGNSINENLGGSTEGLGDLANVIVTFKGFGKESGRNAPEELVGKMTPLPDASASTK